jgi:hypothetical protein
MDLPSPDEQDWQHWLNHKELFGEKNMTMNELRKTP